MLKNKIFRALPALLVFAALRPAGLAAATQGSFLKLGTGARALGMGSAYTAITSDVHSLYWNPSGLARLTRPEAAVSHAALYQDIGYDFFGYAHPTKAGTFGLGGVYLRQKDLEGRAEDRSRTGDFSASDFAFIVGAARQVRPGLSLGINGKIIQSQIAQESSSALAFDIGAQTVFPGTQLQVGAALLNLGQKMKFKDQGYDLPLTLALGAGYHAFKFLLLSADIKYQPHDAQTAFSLGSEFSFVPWASLRAGYLSRTATLNTFQNGNLADKSLDLSGLGLGFGAKIGPGRLDYSINPAGELGNAHHISLSFSF